MFVDGRSKVKVLYVGRTVRMTVVVVVVVLVVGPISSAAMRAYCTVTPLMDFRHSSPEALHTKRRERPLLAKDSTKS
jgi:hypothetical protein